MSILFLEQNNTLIQGIISIFSYKHTAEKLKEVSQLSKILQIYCKNYIKCLWKYQCSLLTTNQ